MQLKDTNIEKLVERRPRSREFERIWNASMTLNPREDFDRLRRLVHYRLCLRTAQALLAPAGPFGDSFCSIFLSFGCLHIGWVRRRSRAREDFDCAAFIDGAIPSDRKSV